MKTRLLVFVALMVGATAMAQKPVREVQKSDAHGLERMKRELALTDNQYASIKSIDSKYAKKRDSDRKKYELRRLEERKSMQSLRMEREREIRQVLTPEQSKKFDAQKAEREKHRNHKTGKRKGKFSDTKHYRKHGRDRHGDR